MRCGATLFAFLGCVALTYAAFTTPIKHVIVLMEENRSFDHFFGYRAGVNGLTGSETNPLNTSDPSAGSVKVTSDSPYIGPCDPNHSVPATTQKLFGLAGMANTSAVPTMDGFIEYERKHKDYCDVMSMFTPQRLPIISTLADEFLLFDRFFASVPGPTWPGRLFCLTGTSAGCTETGTYYQNIKDKAYPQKTIFDSLAEQNLTWANYFDDTPWELFLETLRKSENRKNIQQMSSFYDAAKTGNLPNFAWINPRASVNASNNEGSNDQHPDHDVALGERLYKDIYEALRNGPAWNETLFIITYDEHGGFFDHVPPPHAPAPDDSKSYPDSFDFKRLGIRIPTLLISPWIQKGVVVSEPLTSQKPTPTSEYDLTSIPASVKKMFALPSFLTKRDAWAATFENYLTELKEPRTDTPATLPDAPTTLSAEAALVEAGNPLNELQTEFVRIYAKMHNVPVPEFTQQGQIGKWLKHHTDLFLSNKHSN